MVFPILARLLLVSQLAPMAQKFVTEQLLKSRLFHRFVAESERQMETLAHRAARTARELADKQARETRRIRRRP